VAIALGKEYIGEKSQEFDETKSNFVADRYWGYMNINARSSFTRKRTAMPYSNHHSISHCQSVIAIMHAPCNRPILFGAK